MQGSVPIRVGQGPVGAWNQEAAEVEGGLLVLLGLHFLSPALAQGAEEYFARCQRLYQRGALDSAQAT